MGELCIGTSPSSPIMLGDLVLLLLWDVHAHRPDWAGRTGGVTPEAGPCPSHHRGGGGQAAA